MVHQTLFLVFSCVNTNPHTKFIVAPIIGILKSLKKRRLYALPSESIKIITLQNWPKSEVDGL